MMRFDIYKGDELAATFVYGNAPRYYGATGEEIAALIAGTAIVYNFWTRETELAPLARAGFILRPILRGDEAALGGYGVDRECRLAT